jgi:hypothetical protein
MPGKLGYFVCKPTAEKKLFHDEVFRVPVLIGKEELVSHEQSPFRADIRALRAEDALVTQI